MNAITKFDGEFRFLSNFYPCDIEFDSLIFPSVEHAYVAAKTTDMFVRNQIQKILYAGAAKIYGGKIRLRPDWDDIKLDLMKQFILQKFNYSHLCSRLLATGDAMLIEENTWGDTFWGVCNGVGQNHLGQILMSIRSMKIQERNI